MNQLNKEEKYTCCPKCGHEKYWPKYINYKEIDLCSRCGYWEPKDIGNVLELEDNHKVDND